MLQTRAYQRKPFIVQAVQVTLENMPAVVAWCGGNLRKDDLHRPYIKVEVHRAANPKQTMAYEGDWVLISATGARVYTDYAFNKSFEEIVDDVEFGRRAAATFKELTMDPYQKPTENVFERPGVDREVVFEKPVGDEKLVQGESVETVVVPNPIQHLKDVRKTPFNRTPDEIREAHRTGSSTPMKEYSDEGREAFRRLYGVYPEEKWAREQGHQPASNVDDIP